MSAFVLELIVSPRDATPVPLEVGAVRRGTLVATITGDRAATELLWVRHVPVREGRATMVPTILPLDVPKVLGDMAKRRAWLHVSHGGQTVTTTLQLIRG